MFLICCQVGGSLCYTNLWNIIFPAKDWFFQKQDYEPELKI